MIEQQPVQADIRDGPCECVEVHRFHDIAVRAERIGPFDVRLLPGRRQDDHFRDGRGAVEEEVQGFGAVAAEENLVRQIALFERPQRELRVILVVFDEQYLDGGWHQGSSVGSVKKNVTPWFTLPSAHTRPPWRCTMRLTMASPTPVPSNCSVLWSRWKTPNNLSA